MFKRRFPSLYALVLTYVVAWGGSAPISAQEQPTHGAALGNWDLPMGLDHPGEAKGALLLPQNNEPYLHFHAVLFEKPHSADGRHGTIKGLLLDPKTHEPVYRVKGIWKGPGTAKEGVWDAAILPLDNHEPIGKMGGKYSDPKPFMPGGDGKFKGAFVIKE